MNNNIRPENISVFTTIHPVFKSYGLLFIIITAGLSKTFSHLGAFAFLMIFLMFFSGVKLVKFAGVLKSFRFILPVIFLTNLFFMSEGLERATFLTSRFILLIGFSAILTMTTDMTALVRVVSVVFVPFRIVGIKRDEAALSMMYSVKLLPVIIKEASSVFKRLKGFKEKFTAIFSVERFYAPFVSSVMEKAAFLDDLQEEKPVYNTKMTDVLFFVLIVAYGAFIYALL